ncbi:hypothetical protein KGM_215739 [Danaus plexippus plexippus]|uniref:Uncharacterized protein n=1 Tax=Danaus plexippus plexippus TaxID=278856 RepID=A0A212EVI5_DANPL|nr:uncharacterized protein LOC116778168 [Danaus plexippus plexippus]OWR45471.1 hypothetical protein KGM_215739 [Danaus plexippus plexippus]
MHLIWAWILVVCTVSCSTAERGSSLRGALEALQRRQRGRTHTQFAQPDYDSVYEYVPPQSYPDYGSELEDSDEQTPKYIVKLLEENERPPETYEYKIIKKNPAYEGFNKKQESPFRERSQHLDNDQLRDLFMDRNSNEENNNVVNPKEESDAEYALLLGQLWSKYKNNKVQHDLDDNAAQGVVKLYKEKIVKKRYPNNWGPIAFKRKRSSDTDFEQSLLRENQKIKNSGDGLEPADPNYNTYVVSDDDKDDIREEYAIAFQPLDDDSITDLADDSQYTYDAIEKRFPVTKRSSSPYKFNSQKKRFVADHGNRDKTNTFRSSSGTDPKIIKDLTKIFSEPEEEIIKSPVKRSSEHAENSHDTKPPIVAMTSHNHTNDYRNFSLEEDISHEGHGRIHPPGVSGKEAGHEHHDHDDHSHDDHTHDHTHHEHGDVENTEEKPIKLKKKSIDWSDYFGIDKRLKKSFNGNINEDRLKKQYFDTFNKEVVYPLNSFRSHNYAKRNFMPPKNKDIPMNSMNNARSLTMLEEKRSLNSESTDETKLDNIDKKLKNMEGLIVDEALNYSNIGEELDSKEEQEMKEKLLSRLAAAYSLEKMRKALKEFKQSLQIQKASGLHRSHDSEMKEKKVAVKKERVMMGNEIPEITKNNDKNDDFEDEQGAGHYLNGRIEEQLSEGYMGGSGRHRTPIMSTVSSTGECPVLSKIVQRCRGVDLLAGDRGQLFLPLCSLHQICYLCGEAPPTTCDLVFLSEADSTCEGDTGCQQAARSALMALRELHDNLADELDGECEANPCLPATLKLNIGWQRALQR